jgi:hypothetical protein
MGTAFLLFFEFSSNYSARSLGSRDSDYPENNICFVDILHPSAYFTHLGKFLNRESRFP